MFFLQTFVIKLLSACETAPLTNIKIYSTALKPLFTRNMEETTDSLSQQSSYFSINLQTGLSHNTLKGYRAALGPILSGYFPNYCLAEDKYIKAMISGGNRRNPSNTHQFPGWDLDKVISFLNSSRDNSILFLTPKTLFVVALACPLRANPGAHSLLNTSF